MNFFKAALFLNLILLATPITTPGQTKSNSEAAQSCRQFAQGFYDWYVPNALKKSESSAWDLALKGKNSVFSPDLVRALQEDSRAQEKAGGDIVGLDFDPFLNTQDPRQKYVLGDVTVNDDSCRVPVHGESTGKRIPKPDVTAELRRENGKWLFVNFHYGKSQWSADENLVDILKKLREDRGQHQ